MPLHRELVTSKFSRIVIASEDEKAIKHFANQNNYADIVLDQINNDRFYDEIFEDEENLTILDIGGNVGLFTLYARDRAAAIYPIEPTPDHFHILKELTKQYPNVHPLNYALYHKDTTIDFYISEENSTMNSIVNQSEIKIPVQARTLKSIIDELGLKKVDIVKCDIEGSEMVAITAETIKPVKDIIDNWFIEIHRTNEVAWPGNLHANRDNIKKILENAGYNVQYVRHDTLFASNPEQA